MSRRTWNQRKMLRGLESQRGPQHTSGTSRCSPVDTWRWVHPVCGGHVISSFHLGHQDGAVLASRLIRLEEDIRSSAEPPVYVCRSEQFLVGPRSFHQQDNVTTNAPLTRTNHRPHLVFLSWSRIFFSISASVRVSSRGHHWSASPVLRMAISTVGRGFSLRTHGDGDARLANRGDDSMTQRSLHTHTHTHLTSVLFCIHVNNQVGILDHSDRDQIRITWSSWWPREQRQQLDWWISEGLGCEQKLDSRREHAAAPCTCTSAQRARTWTESLKKPAGWRGGLRCPGVPSCRTPA